MTLYFLMRKYFTMFTIFDQGMPFEMDLLVQQVNALDVCLRSSVFGHKRQFIFPSFIYIVIKKVLRIIN